MKPTSQPGSMETTRETIRRQSPGLDQFVASIRSQFGLYILDLAGATQANISFITDLHHRVYSDDFVKALDTAFGEGDFFANQADPARVERFMTQTLDFPERHFGGALVWDTLQFLTPELLQDTVDHLYEILQPNASMLAFFHSDEKKHAVPLYSYRIQDPKTVLLTTRGRHREALFLNNRAIEKLFARFKAVKFFLTRDHLREVLVTK